MPARPRPRPRPRPSTRAIAFASIALACAFTGRAHAQQGTGTDAGPDSGEAEIRIEKIDQVQITKVDDILIGVFPSNATIDSRQFRVDQFDYQCVHSTTGGYSLDVTSANGDGRFTLTSGTSGIVPEPEMRYEVHLWFREQGGDFRYVSTRYRRAPIALPNLSASLSPTCADEGLDNSNLIVTGVVQQNDFNRAPPGIYRDVLTITVRPE